jgi:DNA invertase Pin-like site-specific DNA recombinase
MFVGYMRVSTDGQDQKVDLQKDALLVAGVDERHLYEDKESGSSRKRKGLEACLSFLKEGDTLVVWKLDRLGRSLSDLISIINELKEKGVRFKSLTENMDTHTAQGELLFGLFGTLAQYERAIICERINAGLAAARNRGRRGGRPRAIDDEKLEVIKQAIDQGMSKAAASRTFNVPISTLYDALGRF